MHCKYKSQELRIKNYHSKSNNIAYLTGANGGKRGNKYTLNFFY